MFNFRWSHSINFSMRGRKWPNFTLLLCELRRKVIPFYNLWSTFYCICVGGVQKSLFNIDFSNYTLCKEYYKGCPRWSRVSNSIFQRNVQPIATYAKWLRQFEYLCATHGWASHFQLFSEIQNTTQFLQLLQ